MAEDGLWRYLRDKLLPAGIHATRVENGVSAGFPDVHYSYRRENGTCTAGTLELKFLRKKKPPFGDDGLNQDQLIWIRDEIESGGTVWILAEIHKVIYMVRGKHASSFNDWNLDNFKLHSTLVIRKGRSLKEARENLKIFL